MWEPVWNIASPGWGMAWTPVYLAECGLICCCSLLVYAALAGIGSLF